MLADLYFARWGLQENWFKAVTPLGLDKHRGNCSRTVVNVAIVTKLERLERKRTQLEERSRELETASAEIEVRASHAAEAQRKASKLLAPRRGRLDALVAENRVHTKGFATAAADHHLKLIAAERAEQAHAAARADLERNRAGRTKLSEELASTKEKIAKAKPMARIRQLNVALDSILTATKLTATQLISHASREYLSELALTPQTYVARVFPLRGRRVRRPEEERIVFYENPRDPEITEALRVACGRLNRRALTREGRRLHYAVEEAPSAPSRGMN